MDYKLDLNIEDLDILDEALVQLPYFKVAKLIVKINKQIIEQEDEDENDIKIKWIQKKIHN